MLIKLHLFGRVFYPWELEVEEHEVLPDNLEFDISKAHKFSKEPRICIRYECVPMRFIRHGEAIIINPFFIVCNMESLRRLCSPNSCSSK